MALYAAHTGYVYQDLVTACFLADALCKRVDEITVDRKSFKGDTLDDLTIRTGAHWLRRQVKHSDTKKLELDDLKSGVIALNALVKSHVEFHGRDTAQYTLVLRWDAPDDADILRFLQACELESSLPGVPVSAYRLDPLSLWPEDSRPVWTQLEDDGFSREDFVSLCNCLTIETQWPRASLDLTTPGVLEEWLLETLRDRVGVGKYPNEGFDLTHVSSTLIRLATICRAEGRTITPTEILHQIGIQTDFGRMPQKFPVVAEKLVHRDQFAEQLETAVLNNKIVIVTGPPGSGKSWSLSELVDKLMAQGLAVGTHYCYLEPGDPSVQQRITSRKLFGNLIAELLDVEPSLNVAKNSRFAADAKELEMMLKQASADTEIVLLVDGLDHISRVFQEATGVAPDEIDIVEQLALLELPPHTHLIIGSQPGDHLKPIVQKAGAIKLPIPSWGIEDMTALATRFGLAMTPQSLALLHERAEGNPLYATFLIKEMRGYIARGEAIDLEGFLRSSPRINGDISQYYEYLAHAVDASKAALIMETLALVDFAITKEDLAAILPPLAHHLSDALQLLEPVLVDVAGQGGVRVYHESFRRFIAERLRAQGVPLEKVLTPVIGWLKNKEFYKDAKAYRFLPPLLRRAGLLNELLNLVKYTFAADSVAAGFAWDAIDANLTLAADVAAECVDWAALARVAELKRSVHTCFEEKLNDVIPYGKAIAAIQGAGTLCERLIFEGAPTFDSKNGLLLCSLADDLGAAPPWGQYLSQYEKDHKSTAEEREAPGTPSMDVSVAKLHGHIRLDGMDKTFPKVLRWLKSKETSPEHGYLLKLFGRLVKLSEPEIMLSIIEDEDIDLDIRRGARKIYVSSLVSRNRRKDALTFLESVSDQFAEGEAVSYVRQGLSFDENKVDVPDPAQFDVQLEGAHHISDENAEVILSWEHSILLNALVAPQRLNDEREKIFGRGWYRQWLRYAIDLAEAELIQFSSQTESQNLAVTALQALEPTDGLFVGTPRTCDLYGLHRVIRDSITRALNLLHDKEAWACALESLEKISSTTTTYLSNSPSGPLEPTALAYILLPYAEKPEVGPLLAEMLEQQVEKARQQAEFYEVQAEVEMTCAHVFATAGNNASAKAHWDNACRHLTAYGFRKDVTLLEVIEPISTIAEWNSDVARECLELTQSLVHGACGHTDGRETRHFPSTWFSMLCKTDLALGLRLLSRSLRLNGGVIDWRLESAINTALNSFGENDLCFLRLLVEFTLPFEDDLSRTTRCLTCVNHIVEEQGGNQQGMRLFRQVATHVLGDPHEVSQNMVSSLEDFSDAHTIPLTSSSDLKIKDDKRNHDKDKIVRMTFDYDHSLQIPLFPKSATPFQMLSELKRSDFPISEASDRHINTLGYHLAELIQDGREESSIRLIYAFADQLRWKENIDTLLSSLAEGLLRFGHKRAAATVYTLAYTRSRGNGGWSNLGGREHFNRLAAAMDLSPDTTLPEIAREVAKKIESTGYNIGITQNLIELLSRLKLYDPAVTTWKSAFEVISYRLPAHEECRGPFLPLKGLAAPLSPEIGLSELLLSRITHPEYRRKNAALSGAQQLFDLSPDLFFDGLADFFKADISCCDMVSTLQILLEQSSPPLSLPDSIANMFKQLAQVDHEGIRTCAQILLQRTGKTCAVTAHDTARLTLSPPLSNEKLRGVLGFDHGRRIEELCEIWPELPDLVARRFDYLFTSSEIIKERTRSRHEASFSRSREKWPVPLRSWFTEIFDLALNEVSAGISKVLWQKGGWSEALEQEISNNLLPSHQAHIRVTESRAIRPAIETPEQIVPGMQCLPKLTEADEFLGWYRLGLFETQMVTGNLSFNIDREVKVFAGAIIGNPPKTGTGMPAGDFSFSDMWPNEKGVVKMFFGRFCGPLIGAEFIRDCNGDSFVLGLHPWLCTCLGLHCNQFPDPLRLVDDNGTPHVAYRQWWSGALWNEFNSEIPRLEGCELLISPEAYARIKQLVEEEPVLVTALL